MRLKLKMWGSSYATRFPIEQIRRLNMQVGDEFIVEEKKDGILLKPISSNLLDKEISLEERKNRLAAKIKAMANEEDSQIIDIGLPVGSELF